MRYLNQISKHGSIMLAMMLTLTSCMEQVPKRELASAPIVNGPTGGSSGGVGATTSGTTGGSGSTAVPPKVEIRNLVEPKITTADYPSYFSGTGLSGAGSYVRKLTLPQNYQGLLYLGGININSLAGRFVKVRFTFGVSKEQVTVPATVARAPGITPNTEIDVVVMDLRQKPFNTQRLIYDLYDYRDYSDPDNDPVETNRDPNLYCRALRLQDDPTFNGQGLCDSLAADGVTPLSEKCLYTYAKVVDRALVRVNGAVETAVYPSLPQLDLTSGKLGYYNQSTDTLLNRCLPDKTLSTVTTIVTGMSNATSATGVQNLSFSLFGQAGTLEQRNASNATIYSQGVKYYGPFKAINANNWEITGDAAFGVNGLFEFTPLYPAGATFGDKLDAMHLHRSKMFPRFSYMDLNLGVNYLKTDILSLDTKTPTTQPVSGPTELVDGCNIRAQSVNYQGNHVGSCNATGKIEILATNDDGTDIVMAETKDVILQLVRATQISGEGNEYLYGNFKTCSNSNQCASGECCYNSRCWNNELVSQCVEQATQVGNLPVGSTCSSDFECSSLCCDLSKGKCGVHDNKLSPPVLCNKPYGQFCLAKEWCQKSNVTNCYIVKTGTDPQGNVTCAKRCYNSQEFGDCRTGVCQPPPAGLNPDFDPSDPAACDEAQDPPNL
ncbi:MAG: hypothetical protein K2P81_02555 [Bacteriovoracaceae bacterium]|nr:hypothetical protein [Bacteriovoracaceae bacterium]